VNSTDKPKVETVSLKTKKNLNNKGIVTVLQSNDLEGMNTIGEPFKISPVESEIVLKGKNLTTTLAPYSLNVVKIKMK
jgi:alpha-L-arabinofuranosidase